MIFHVLTIFPEFFEGPFAHGVVKRAKDSGILDIRIHDLRNWTHDVHRTDPAFTGRKNFPTERGQSQLLQRFTARTLSDRHFHQLLVTAAVVERALCA